MFIQTNEDGTYWRKIKPLRNFEFSGTCFQPPETLTVEEAALYRVFPLTLVVKPAFNSITQAVAAADPVKIANVWMQQWNVIPLDPAVAAANQAAYNLKTSDEAVKLAAKMDSTINYLVTHSASEIEAKVSSDVTSIATAKVYLAKLAIAVGVLARRELR